MTAHLRQRMHEQSAKLAEAVDHASGVYFPNRAHDVRIHTKRLRYLAELAAEGSRSHDDRELIVLKRVQSVLGNLHDRELIMERLERYGEQAVGFEALRQRLIAERDGLFKDYLSRRDELREVAKSIRARTASPASNWIPLAAMLALPSALVIGLAGSRRMRAAQRQSVLRPMPHTPLPTGRAPGPLGEVHPRSSQSTHATS
jgi:hypothetical protein